MKNNKAKNSLLLKSLLKSGLVFSLGITVTGCREITRLRILKFQMIQLYMSLFILLVVYLSWMIF